ncbi:MAG: hypothetical protein U0169_16430 [Polyangiaceae bacterium]
MGSQAAVDRVKEPSRVVVATHGHCFDGMCSAAMFTRLLRHVNPGVDYAFEYHAMGYGPGQNGVDPALLDGAENAVLDFRWSSAKTLTWYFDHHVSAFPEKDDRERYEELSKGKVGSARRVFHDGGYGSCTKLIADVGARDFGLDPEPFRSLVGWADMIDRAAFPSAQMAVNRAEPELQLMSVVEQYADDAFLARIVPRLLVEPIADIARASDVVAAYEPLRAAHESFVNLVKDHAVTNGDVVVVDLTDSTIEVAAKFVTYALFPTSAYSVVVTRSKSKCKLSIGFNPWCGKTRTHNIAAICERHGGGGHPVVGAISLTADRVAEAKALANDIATELATP